MPAALNNFRTTLADITTTPTTVYTPPLGYATVVLLAQVRSLITTDPYPVHRRLQCSAGSSPSTFAASSQ